MPQPSPDLFTVSEAASVLRIGRTTAYELARRDLATGGGERLRVIRIGGQLRIPRAALEQLIGSPVAVPAAAPIEAASSPDQSTAPIGHQTSSAPRRRQATSADQLRFES